MKKNSLNLIIAGTGGQGVLLVGDFIAQAFVKAGYDVKVSALRGIAQRGGTVEVHLRSGEKVHSPLIPKGKADMLVALDLGEAMKRIDYLKKDGHLFFWGRKRLLELEDREALKKSRSFFKTAGKDSNGKVFPVECEQVIKQIKDTKTINVFMAGVLSHYLSLRKSFWLRAMEETLPQSMGSRNSDSFSAGIRYAREREQGRESFV